MGCDFGGGGAPMEWRDALSEEKYGRNGFIGPSKERATYYYYYRTAHRIAIKCYGHASNAIQSVSLVV